MSKNLPSTFRMKSNNMFDDVNSLELVFGVDSATDAIRLKTKIQFFVLWRPLRFQFYIYYYLLLHARIFYFFIFRSVCLSSERHFMRFSHSHNMMDRCISIQQYSICMFRCFVRHHLLFNSLSFMMSDVRTSAERRVLILYGWKFRF